jgi:hypothetical protein
MVYGKGCQLAVRRHGNRNLAFRLYLWQDVIRHMGTIGTQGELIMPLIDAEGSEVSLQSDRLSRCDTLSTTLQRRSPIQILAYLCSIYRSF